MSEAIAAERLGPLCNCEDGNKYGLPHHHIVIPYRPTLIDAMNVDVNESELRAKRAADARWSWNLKRGKRDLKCSLGFDQLLELFSSDCNSFLAIGAMSNPPVTRELIRQLYQKFSADIFGKHDGHTRQKLCTVKRWKVAATELPTTFPAREIAEEARRRGLSCELVRHHGKAKVGKFTSARLRINGHLVAALGCHTRFKTKGRTEYAHFRSLKETDCSHQIFVTGIEGIPTRFFIVPSTDLAGKESIYARITDLCPTRKANPGWTGGGLAPYENAWNSLA